MIYLDNFLKICIYIEQKIFVSNKDGFYLVHLIWTSARQLR
jgi:hypothetical protein